MNNPEPEFDIVVHGTLCLDAIWRVPALPPLGAYLDIEEDRLMVGGEACNTAIALARWGAKVALVGNALGEDEDGVRLRRLFLSQAPELDTRFVTTSAAAQTPFCLCLATPDGHRTMIGKGFTNMEVAPFQPAQFPRAKWFTTDPNAWGASVSALHAAADAGMSVVPMDFTAEESLHPKTAIQLTSAAHIGAEKSLGELAEFAENLRNRGGATTLVTAGERGCLVAESGKQGEPALHVPAYVSPKVVDATGAGDVFRAGILFGSHKGWGLLQTVRFAAAAAALNCTEMGGWGGVLPLAEIIAFQQFAPTHAKPDL